jgi:ribonuclease BN (tRNA processing enzyme)
VQTDDTSVLIDCGNGVFAKMRERLDYVDLDGIVISHLHADHILDLVPYAYALTYAPRQQPVPVPPWPGTETPARPYLYAPEGAKELFRRIVSSWGNEDLIDSAFELSEYDPSDEISIGSLNFRFCRVPHYMPTFAIECASNNGGGRVTYSADSSPSEELVSFAKDTDLLLIEATLPRPERTGIRGHLTPSEAGDHGKRAGARRLCITHFSDELDRTWARKQAEAAFGNRVEVAREGLVLEI